MILSYYNQIYSPRLYQPQRSLLIACKSMLHPSSLSFSQLHEHTSSSKAIKPHKSRRASQVAHSLSLYTRSNTQEANPNKRVNARGKSEPFALRKTWSRQSIFTRRVKLRGCKGEEGWKGSLWLGSRGGENSRSAALKSEKGIEEKQQKSEVSQAELKQFHTGDQNAAV